MNKKLSKQFEKIEKTTDVLSLSTSYITEDFIESPLIVAGTEHYMRLINNSLQNILKQMKEEYRLNIALTDGMVWSDLAYKGIISSDTAAWMTKLEAKLQRQYTHGLSDPHEVYVLACNMTGCFNLVCSSLKSWVERLGSNKAQYVG